MQMQTQTLLLTHQPHRSFVSELLPWLSNLHYPEVQDFEVPSHLDRHFLGCGYFSTVWAIPGEPFKVLKISHRETDACRHYMRWVFDTPHPSAPKIHSIEYHGDFMCVVMDKYRRHPDFPMFTRTNVPGAAVLVGNKRANPSLGYEVLCEKIRKNFGGYKFDLHSENVMVNRKGEVIITDPVSFISQEACDGDY